MVILLIAFLFIFLIGMRPLPPGSSEFYPNMQSSKVGYIMALNYFLRGRGVRPQPPKQTKKFCLLFLFKSK